MVTGDGAYIKKINRIVILQTILGQGKISRTELSKATGLNKATISVQVADLLADNLICETAHEQPSGIGRRPIMLSINSEEGFVLGIDFDYREIQFAVSDLQGHAVETNFILLETTNYNEIVQILIKHIKHFQSKYSNSHFGMTHAIIGIHGTVNKDETIYFIPKYQWRNKDLKRDLQQELDIVITIENNANLSSYAEKVYQYPESSNLLTIILSSGIGSGTIIDGQVQKGYHGYAGEMGHMIIHPGGKSCRCGNFGCWELYASEPNLLTELTEKLNRPSLTYEDIKKLLNERNPIVCRQIEEFIMYLSIGLNNVINLYNPEVIVLNSDILKLYPNVIEEIKRNIKSSVSQYREILMSQLGKKACVMGACALAIERFLEIPELILSRPMENYFEINGLEVMEH